MKSSCRPLVILSNVLEAAPYIPILTHGLLPLRQQIALLDLRPLFVENINSILWPPKQS
jgi:hypothetical protein